MIKWLEDYVKSLVRQADQVSISLKEEIKVVIVTITVGSDDQVLFAGRNNRLLRALSSAVSLVGTRSRVRYVVKVAN